MSCSSSREERGGSAAVQAASICVLARTVGDVRGGRAHRAHEADYEVGVDGVEGTGWLVEEKDGRICGKLHTNAHTAHLPPRKAAHPHILGEDKVGDVVKPQQLQHGRHAVRNRRHRLAARGAKPGGEHEALEDGKLLEEVVVRLEHEANHVLQPLGVVGCPVKSDRAAPSTVGLVWAGM